MRLGSVGRTTNRVSRHLDRYSAGARSSALEPLTPILSTARLTAEAGDVVSEGKGEPLRPRAAAAAGAGAAVVAGMQEGAAAAAVGRGAARVVVASGAKSIWRKGGGAMRSGSVAAEVRRRSSMVLSQATARRDR
jgi:hypothetical protein